MILCQQMSLIEGASVFLHSFNYSTNKRLIFLSLLKSQTYKMLILIMVVVFFRVSFFFWWINKKVHTQIKWQREEERREREKRSRQRFDVQFEHYDHNITLFYWGGHLLKIVIQIDSIAMGFVGVDDDDSSKSIFNFLIFT